MRLFPRVILRWKEPKVLRIEGAREGKRSLMRMVLISILAALPIIGLTQSLAPVAVGRVCMALGLVIVFMGFVFWVYRVFPSWVTVTERGISQSVTTDDEQTWKFEAIRQCAIVPRHVSGRVVRMLVIETRRGDHASVGIADSVSTGELQAALVALGVEVIRASDHPVDA